MTDSERVVLIRKVYKTAFGRMDSFENATGAFLLYLVEAIAGGDKCELFPLKIDEESYVPVELQEISDDTAVLHNMKLMFPADNAVWQFIEVHEEEQGMAKCGHCGEERDDVESTYCGSMCGECREKHAEECEVCKKDFEERGI